MLSNLQLGVTFINGTAFGALTFVGAVDVRLFLTLIKSNSGSNSIKTIFPLWWPFGRDLMAPLGVAGILANLALYHQTNNQYCLVPAASHFVTIIWTIVVMGEDIGRLVEGKNDEVETMTRSFCLAHFPRILFAGIGFIYTLWTL